MNFYSIFIFHFYELLLRIKYLYEIFNHIYTLFIILMKYPPYKANILNFSRDWFGTIQSVFITYFPKTKRKRGVTTHNSLGKSWYQSFCIIILPTQKCVTFLSLLFKTHTSSIPELLLIQSVHSVPRVPHFLHGFVNTLTRGL